MVGNDTSPYIKAYPVIQIIVNIILLHLTNCNFKVSCMSISCSLDKVVMIICISHVIAKSQLDVYTGLFLSGTIMVHNTPQKTCEKYHQAGLSTLDINL